MKFKSDCKSLFFTLLFLYLGFNALTFFPSFDFKTKQISLTYLSSTIILFISFATYFILDRTKRYYYLDHKKIIVKRVFSKKEIAYKDIAYIDAKKINKKLIRLHLKNSETLNIVTDKDKKIFVQLQKKCKSAIIDIK